MRFLGRTERRVVTAILITALIPLVAALFIGRTVISRISASAFQPEFGEHLDKSLGVYADLVKSMKQGMRAETDVIVLSDGLRAAIAADDKAAIQAQLESQFASHPTLVSAGLENAEGTPIVPSASRRA